MRACDAGVVPVMAQGICGVVMRAVRNENGGGGSSPGWDSSACPIDGAAVQTRRRSGLEPSQAEAATRQRLRRGRPRAPRRRGPAAIFSSPIWMSPRRNVPVVMTTAPAARRSPAPVTTPAHGAGRIQHQILGRGFDDGKIGALGEQRLHRLAIELAVGLGARPAHGRALAAVQDAELDPGAVDDARHHAIERVDFAHQMPLGQAADRRVARHFADRLPAVRQQQRVGAQTRRRVGRLAAGMAAADDDDVETIARAGVHEGAI